MKYTIEGFSQEYALTLQKVIKEKDKVKTIKVDGTDLIILRWFVDFYPHMAKIEIERVQYAWISYKKLLEDMPLLDMGKHMLAIRLQKLCEFGILIHKTVKHGGSFSYYGFGENYHNLVERRSATNGDLMQDIADPLCNEVQTPCAKNCSTNNSSINHSSIKEPSKKERKTESKQSTFNQMIDLYTTDTNLKQALIEFIRMRTRIKKPLTNHAFSLILHKLDIMTNNTSDKIEIVNQSIINSWQDVFDLRKNKQQSQKPEKQGDVFDIEEQAAIQWGEA